MDIEEIRDYCLAKKAVEESLPFDENTLVFKVMGKMFALTNIEDFKSINLKCDPNFALDLRADYDAVTPGYHMNKKHWNTVHCFKDLPEKKIYELIDHSYMLVIQKLPKKLQIDF